jgi:hypothetical protein
VIVLRQGGFNTVINSTIISIGNSSINTTINSTSLIINSKNYTFANSLETLQTSYTDKPVSVDTVWQVANTVTLADAANIAVNLATSVNFQVTLAGNRNLDNPSNVIVGKTGFINIIQDGSGNKTLSYSANWKFAGGTAPVLSTAASARDILFYYAVNSTFIFATLTKDVK